MKDVRPCAQLLPLISIQQIPFPPPHVTSKQGMTASGTSMRKRSSPMLYMLWARSRIRFAIHEASGKPSSPLLLRPALGLLARPALPLPIHVLTVAALPHSQPVLLVVLRVGFPRLGSLIGLKLRPRTQAWVGAVLELLEATPLAAGVTTARKCTRALTAAGTDLTQPRPRQSIHAQKLAGTEN